MKPLKYKKKATNIFAEVKQLVQCLQSIVTEHYINLDSIILIVAFNSLYNNFEMTIALFCILVTKILKKFNRLSPLPKRSIWQKKLSAKLQIWQWWQKREQITANCLKSLKIMKNAFIAKKKDNMLEIAI